MTKLREIGFGWIRWIQSRSRVVWREQHQRVQERDQAALIVGLQRSERVPSSEGFAPMAENDIVQCHAAAVMAVGPGASDTPQWSGQKLRLQRSIPVTLVEVRPQVMPLEVRKDVFHHERIFQRQFQQWLSTAVVLRVIQRARGREQAVEH